MRRIGLIVLSITLLVILKSSLAQSGSAWEQVVPRLTFGYGGLVGVSWSPINGQLAAVSESGFQFYNQDMLLQGERRFNEPQRRTVVFSPNMRYVALEDFGALVVHQASQITLAVTGIVGSRLDNATFCLAWRPSPALARRPVSSRAIDHLLHLAWMPMAGMISAQRPYSSATIFCSCSGLVPSAVSPWSLIPPQARSARTPSAPRTGTPFE